MARNAVTVPLCSLRIGAVALLAGLVSVACGGDDTTRGAGGVCGGAKCDEVEGGSAGETAEEHPEFRKAIEACEVGASRLRDRTHDERWDSLTSIERTRAECLATANDEIVPAVNDVVRVRADALAGKLRGNIEDYRGARELVCVTLVDASRHALEKSGAVAMEACAAHSELDMAQLISAYVDLGVKPLVLADSRVRYPACWDAFDDEVQDAALASQTLDATEGLMQCVLDANEDASAKLVENIQEQFPGRASKTLEQDTQRGLRSHRNAIKDVCEALTIAGPTVDSGEVNLSWVQCRIGGLSMVGHLGDKLVPGVWPQGAESGPSDSGSGDTGDGEDTGGGESDGSTGSDGDTSTGGDSGGSTGG